MPRSRCIAWLLIAIAIAGCGQPRPSASGPNSPHASASSEAQASPTDALTKPYRLTSSNEVRDRVIDAPDDCADLPTAWLIEYCGLALRGDWRSIAGDDDPRLTSASWYAAMSRAQIDGDLAVCDDVRMRTWISAAPNPVAPPPEATPAPRIGPIAECRTNLMEPPRAGVLSISDPTRPPLEHASVTIVFEPPTIAPLPPPRIDPYVLCDTFGSEPISAATCARIVEAILALPEYDAASINVVGVRSNVLPCEPAMECAPPSAATALGNTLVAFLDGSGVYLNAWDRDGSIQFGPVIDLPSPSPS